MTFRDQVKKRERLRVLIGTSSLDDVESYLLNINHAIEATMLNENQYREEISKDAARGNANRPGRGHTEATRRRDIMRAGQTTTPTRPRRRRRRRRRPKSMPASNRSRSRSNRQDLPTATSGPQPKGLHDQCSNGNGNDGMDSGHSFLKDLLCSNVRQQMQEDRNHLAGKPGASTKEGGSIIQLDTCGTEWLRALRDTVTSICRTSAVEQVFVSQRDRGTHDTAIKGRGLCVSPALTSNRTAENALSARPLHPPIH